MDMELDKQKIEELAEKYDLEFVLLFGSQTTGKTHPLSDTDMAFSANRRISPAEVARMQLDFSQNLRIKDLEFADIKDASPLLLKKIAENSQLLYAKSRFLYAEFKIYAYKRYIEAKPLLKLRESQLNNFLCL